MTGTHHVIDTKVKLVEGQVLLDLCGRLAGRVLQAGEPRKV
jgi:hypothetical protein